MQQSPSIQSRILGLCFLSLLKRKNYIALTFDFENHTAIHTLVPTFNTKETIHKRSVYSNQLLLFTLTLHNSPNIPKKY